MSQTDPHKALSDETFWYPKQMYNKDKPFVFATTEVTTLHKYVLDGSLLPTTPDEYIAKLGITDQIELENESDVWKAILEVLDVYKEVILNFQPPPNSLARLTNSIIRSKLLA